MENEDRIARLTQIAAERRAACERQATQAQSIHDGQRGGYGPTHQAPRYIYDAFDVTSITEKRTYERPSEQVPQPLAHEVERWVLTGIRSGVVLDTLATFETEDQARRLLGRITGDRHYDQRPASDTVARAVAMEQRGETAYIPGRWGDEASYDMNYAVPTLHDLMPRYGNSDSSTIAQAQHDARIASRIEAVDAFRKEHPVKAFIGGGDYVQAKADDLDKGLLHRPSDRILGRDELLDREDQIEAQRLSRGIRP